MCSTILFLEKTKVTFQTFVGFLHFMIWQLTIAVKKSSTMYYMCLSILFGENQSHISNICMFTRQGGWSKNVHFCQLFVNVVCERPLNKNVLFIWGWKGAAGLFCCGRFYCWTFLLWEILMLDFLASGQMNCTAGKSKLGKSNSI